MQMACGVLPAAAQSFSDILELARANDATYLGAVAELDAARKRYEQAVGEGMPQLNGSYGSQKLKRDYTTLGSRLPPDVSEYDSTTWQLNLTQPLWRPTANRAMEQAQAIIAQHRHQVQAASDELTIRLAQAWFEVMSARDKVLLCTGQAHAAEREWQQMVKAASIDFASAPKLEEAAARHQLADAERFAAETDQQIALAQIEQITGSPAPLQPPYLLEQFRIPDAAHDLAELSDLAERANPFVLSAQNALLAANAEVAKQRAGHQPTIDLVGSYSFNNQDVGDFPGQRGYEIRQRAVGLQISVPIFSSGVQSARVGEALALRAKAEHELRGAILSARTVSKTAWLALRSGAARERAGIQNVRSATLAVRTASSSVARGLSFDLEVLQAREELLQAWQELQGARYDSVVSWLKLRASIGELDDENTKLIDAMTAPTPSLPAEAIYLVRQ